MAIIGVRSNTKSPFIVPGIRTGLIIHQANNTESGESNTFTPASWNGSLCRALNFVANRNAQRQMPMCRIDRRAPVVPPLGDGD